MTSRHRPWYPYVGIAWPVLLLAAAGMIGAGPTPDTPAREALAFFQESATKVRVAALMFGLAAVAFLVFVAGACSSLVQQAAPRSTATAFATLGVAYLSVDLLSDIAYFAPAFLPAPTEAATHASIVIHDVVHHFSPLLLGGAVLSGTIAHQGSRLHNPLVLWLGLVTGAALLLTGALALLDVIPVELTWLGFIPALAWVAVVSVRHLRPAIAPGDAFPDDTLARLIE